MTVNISHPKFTDEKVDFKIMMGAGANAPHFYIHETSLKFKRFDFMMPLVTEELIFGYPQTHMSGVVNGTLTEISFDDILKWLEKRFSLDHED